jgi:oxygen-dependent protoporphyrinogen oxidase
MKRIAIIGGGIAGVTAAYELARLAHDGAPVEATLFEATGRLGGIVETVREGGFIIETGPDGWVSEKPWARELAEELGLRDELIPSNDATRRTYILEGNTLHAIPDGLRMMVPTDLDALDQSDLFSLAARQAYRDEPARAAELIASSPLIDEQTDESIASFVERHFGTEVLETIASPLLSGVLGGDVATLSVRAVMGPFVTMERTHGSLITALQSRVARNTPPPIFTSLRSGTATLIERMVATIPPAWLRLNAPVAEMIREEMGWTVRCSGAKNPTQHFDEVFLSTPVDRARTLLSPHDPQAADLMQMESSSALIVAFALPDAAQFPVPPGFGFLVPPKASRAEEAFGLHPKTTSSLLLACTFSDQKYDHRVPPGGRLIRAFFGGPTSERMMRCGNDEIASIARLELARIFGPMPAAQITVVRRWPRSLPQYSVGHLDRMAELAARVGRIPGLHLLGNGYRGVGLPDLVRDARAAARAILLG